MADLQAQVLELLKGLTRVVRTLRMYAATHPQVQKDMDACFGVIETVLGGQDSLHVGVTEGLLIVEGRPIKDESASFKTFAEMLRSKHLASFKISRGVTREEFLELVRLLCMKAEDALKDDHVMPELLAKMDHIKVNELRFVSVEGDQEVGAAGSGAGGPAISQETREVAEALVEAGARTREDTLAVIQGLFDTSARQAPGDPASGADGVVRFFDSIQESVRSLDAETAAVTVRQYFQKLVAERLGGQGVTELRDSVAQIAASLSPEMQKLLFGENFADPASVDPFRLLRAFDATLRSSPVVADLLTGKVDPEQLRRAMDLIAPAPAEFVKLYEQVSAQLLENRADPAQVQEAMTRLFKTLKIRKEAEELPTNLEGTVLVCDPEEIDAGGYPLDLEEWGFTVIKYMDGRKAWDHVRSRGDVQCLIMEIKMPGISGLEILANLTEARRELPVIVITGHAQFQDAFEVASYPKIRYFVKPVDLDELKGALVEFLPQQPPEEEPEHVLPEELKRAQEIQEKLIPTEAPVLPAYDLAFYYKPALAVGGDYVDFLPLDDRRLGIIVADVSGKNITGAMVMVMVRSVFRMLSRMCESAVDTVIRVNEIVSRDIRRGMFVSAIYGILDRERNTLEVVNCGHNPALVWTRDFGLSQYLSISGTAIGLFSGATFERSLRSEYVSFEPGDRILLYTDGVVEAMDPKGGEFTEKQLLKLVNANAEKSSHDLVQGLVGALDRHRATADQSDDITILSIARKLDGDTG